MRGVTMLRAAAWIGAAGWIALAVARSRFWDASTDCLSEPSASDPAPDVHAVVPARNEADVLARTLASLLVQRYPGRLAITVVDDASDDGTADVARRTISQTIRAHAAEVVGAPARPEGWTGKLWALQAGVDAARSAGTPTYWWFTDADVEHDPDTLARLVATAQRKRKDLVSQMVELHCRSEWERLLIPAFVFFFRMLYPFAPINDDRRRAAGAAGGCVLLSDALLTRIGGLQTIRGELIDDCSLARAVKDAGGTLWLGLTTRSRSVRPYRGLASIWSMVARTAYTQLDRSPALLGATAAGMLLLYAGPPVATLAAIARGRVDLAIPGALGWAVMTALYLPTVRVYRLAPWRALALPLAALLYTAMTLDSGRREVRGERGLWKGRLLTGR